MTYFFCHGNDLYNKRNYKQVQYTTLCFHTNTTCQPNANWLFHPWEWTDIRTALSQELYGYCHNSTVPSLILHFCCVYLHSTLKECTPNIDWCWDYMGQLTNEWILGCVSGIPRRFWRRRWHHHQLGKGEGAWDQDHLTHSLIFDYYQFYSLILLVYFSSYSYIH